MATVSPDTQAGLYPPRPTQTTASPSSHPPAISSGSASVGESPGEKQILATFIYDHIVEDCPPPKNDLVQSAPQRWCDSGESIATGCVLCQHRPWPKGSQFLGNICIDASIRAKYIFVLCRWITWAWQTWAKLWILKLVRCTNRYHQICSDKKNDRSADR